MIHSVIFKLKHEIGSHEETAFMNAARKLSDIPGVRDFECLKQTSPKNNFDYGLSMRFETQEAHETYSNHPEHVQFLENFWAKDVVDFLEIDYEKLD
jgi:heme-degrading monooxygenase HmoA